MKKVKFLTLGILVAMIAAFIPNFAKATTLTTPIYLGIQEYRTGTTPADMGYAINNPDANGSTSDSIVGTKIWDIVRYNSLSDTNYDDSVDFYCVKAGVGFRDTGEKDTYNISFNYKTERQAILDTGNPVLESIVNIDNNTYYYIMALADLMYSRNSPTAADDRAKLISDAGIHDGEFPTGPITDSDIDAIQQAALWYFTNYDDALFEKIYNQYGKAEDSSWLTYKISSMSGYTSLSDYDKAGEKAGEQRQRQAVRIYNYLIKTAKENAAAYKAGTASSNTKITLYANATKTTTQPVIVIEKIPEVKEFDLALRKYITKVGNVTLSGDSSRIPNIKTESLVEGTTATYQHRKDPVPVETGTVVTYNLTVYNEGDKAGRATKIIDQLPTGLKYKSLITTGFSASYDATNNKVTITRDSSNTTNLEAYKDGNLQSEIIQIECEVTQKPDANNSIVLTNVAWIAEQYDAVDKVTITNQEGLDRDSEPSTVPSVNKNNMSNYKGTTSQTDLSQNIYYPGQQDDDDFEKLILEPKSFDLKLIKRIVEVNGVKQQERIESVDVSKLNTVDSNGNKITTADYKLNKTPIIVKKGDIVKYTLRVYNEGDIDGYASEISEDIPDGLEFLWSEKTDEELDADTSLTKKEKEAIIYNQGIWDIKTLNSTTGKIEMISTNYLAKGNGAEATGGDANLIKAFDSSKGYVNQVNDKNPDYKEVSVYMKVVSENTTGTIIRNEAAITGDTDADGNTVTDRDSKPEDWVKYEDDEDYDNVKLQIFDLALRKFIIAVSQDVKIDNEEYLKDSNGSYTRAPQVDTSKLNTIGEDGKLITTATYNHPKTPVPVEKGDIVVYMLRVYNEGEISGYASEIKDHLPSNLEFVKGEFNTQYGWSVSEDGRTVTTTYLKDSLIKGTTTNDAGKIVLSYQEVPIMCKVKNTAVASEKITNIADITEYKDENKNNITDRDSEENNVTLPEDKDLPNYKDDEKGSYVPGQQDDDDFEKVIVKTFDLALRKFITGVDNEKVTSRIPQVKYDSENNKITYEHTKEPVEVYNGNVVTYTIRIFNEGESSGYAKEVTDDLPEGLEFLPDNEINKEYRWVMYDEEGKETTDVEKAVKITTDYLSKEQGEARMEKDATITENPNLLKAFNQDKEISDSNPDYKDVKIAFKVVESNSSDRILVNAAQISEDSDKEGNPIEDIDSVPGKWNEGEDDQDKEYVKLLDFDLALRKFIIAVSSDIKIDDNDYLKDSNGTYTRAPQVDTSKLNTIGEDGKLITTATYNHPKTPVPVEKGDIVVYMLRVYNEGEIDGYASEIKDHLPQNLEFVESEFNNKYGWKVSEDGRTVTTEYLKDSLIKRSSINGAGDIELSYKQVPIMCKVKATAVPNEKITNIADITEYKDKNKADIIDRDSEENNVVLPEDKDLPNYKDDEKGSYVPGQQDDDDFEKIIIKTFDLALRKFITGVNNEEVTSRIPQVKYDSENNKITYEHTKEPVEVYNGNVVTYTIRIFNEGESSGYAKEVTDDLPEGLEFLPDNEINKEYRWVMYDEEGKETTDVEKAVKITTDYLSKEQGEARMEKDATITENPNLLKAFNPDKEISDSNPDYKDVKIAFKVVEPNSSDKILVNSAQISEDSNKEGNPIEDIDSVPGKWNEGEDDQDKEYVKLLDFDLALRKWVTQAIVIENGKQTITQTGHTPEQDPEPVVKVELNRKNLNNVTVKFKYSIRVTNEGDIAGYAKEITDYVPEGLKFIATDNPNWKDEGNNVISTKALENTLLQPGEHADVEVILTWINGQDNMGLKTNTAEISEDYNDKGVPDRDSTPDNKVPGEDDIDDAPVILSIKTGKAKIYYTLGFVVLITVAGGIVLIKKFVL